MTFVLLDIPLCNLFFVFIFFVNVIESCAIKTLEAVMVRVVGKERMLRLLVYLGHVRPSREVSVLGLTRK